MGDNIPDNAIHQVEWWVMRVWLGPTGRAVDIHRCSLGVQLAVSAAVAVGKLAIIPQQDGSGIVCEPVECFEGIEGQLAADARRAILKAAHPGEEFRVVMNADV